MGIGRHCNKVGLAIINKVSLLWCCILIINFCYKNGYSIFNLVVNIAIFIINNIHWQTSWWDHIVVCFDCINNM